MNQLTVPGLAPDCGNPMIAGYYADPSLVQFEDKFYVYATLDPWGGDTLGCWESDDFKNWTYRVLNWPTKAACTSATSGASMVWAPSVVRGKDGRFTMYVSVGSEVWAGVAAHPLGPWSNILGDQPMIAGNAKPDFHMIDAEAFIDDDGSAWLYWGSGWNWKNGHCFAAQLAPDMVSFIGETRDVTPTNYFEAPFMIKRGGRYFLMYSDGRTDRDTYQVHYAVGDNPLGPFEEAANSPILVTDSALNISSPGHHAVFQLGGRDYIFYHRHSIPFNPKSMGRQLCVDEMHITPEGIIEKVTPTHEGPALVQRAPVTGDMAHFAKATASSQLGPLFGPERVLDNNYSSRWSAGVEEKESWIQLNLGEVRDLSRQIIRPEYAWKPLNLRFLVSLDGENWQTLADFRTAPTSGSPIIIEADAKAQFVRLEFAQSAASLFEWQVL